MNAPSTSLVNDAIERWATHQAIPEVDIPRLQRGVNSYIKELVLWNPKLGLVEAQGDDLVNRHLMDCLYGVGPLMAQLGVRHGPVLRGLQAGDIGSGAGLPGLLLALAMPMVHWNLVEKQARRCSFLLNAQAKMGLENVTIHQTDLTSMEPGNLDFLTTRAFRPLEPGIFNDLRAVLKPRGFMMHYKGRREKIQEELGTLNPGDQAYWTIEPLSIPGLSEERHLAWYLPWE